MEHEAFGSPSAVPASRSPSPLAEPSPQPDEEEAAEEAVETTEEDYRLDDADEERS